MTHDAKNIPRIPNDVPEAARKPRTTLPDGIADRDARETRAASAGATGSTAEPRPQGVSAGTPRTQAAPAAAPLIGDAAADAPDARASDARRPLFPEHDHDRLAQRIQHAVSEFVESPRHAVEEAERTFDTVVEGLTGALEEHRRTLAAVGRDGDPEMRTEELRVTLQRYRDLTERLLNV
nr:hypothetical protein OG461_34970 [Streptomyces sp. NBC_00995]